jgi:hypothetical protein
VEEDFGVILNRIATALRGRDWAAVAIEFAVVVLGIFVALQAENWNQERTNRQLEQVYISRLADETRANLSSLKQHEQIFEEKVQFIFSLPDLHLDEAIQRDPDAFIYQLDNSAYVAIPDLRSETYEELESSGRLALLRDAQLRGAIASNLNDYRSVRPVLSQPIGGYRRLLFETLPGRSYYDFRFGTGDADSAAITASVEAFRSDPRFEAAANAEISYGSDVLYWVRVFIRRSEGVLALLEASE